MQRIKIIKMISMLETIHHRISFRKNESYSISFKYPNAFLVPNQKARVRVLSDALDSYQCKTK